MAEHCNLYDRAMYYDVIFNRDVTRDITFLDQLYKKVTGRTPESVLDMACGPGYHARAFAKRGIKSYGLDLRAEMLRFAQDEAQKEGVNVRWIEADMRTFQLDKPVDMTFCMFDGLDCLLTNDNIKRHFVAVAKNLTANGLYIVDLSHPSEIDWTHYKKFHYQGERDGVRVDIHWATNDPLYDLATGIAHVEVQMKVQESGRSFVVTDAAEERLMFPQEIALLAELSESLKVIGWYGDFDINQPLDSTSKSRRMIGVLQKVR